MTVRVTLRNVSKVFPAGATTAPLHALGPLDLELRRGEFFAAVGPSGCGKSTLLEIIAGLASATQGSVEFEGRPIAGEAPDGVGVVFQEDASLPWLNVAENVAFGLRRLALRNDERETRVRDVLDLVGLSDFAASYPSQLSGGMRQRVCIARTLVMQPRLILLDEPFGALDQQTRLLMGDELLRMWRETGATVFLITHALDEATMQAPHLIVRDLVRLLASGKMNTAIVKTMTNTVLALGLALGVGIIAGVLLHRRRALRHTLDPLFATYYAVPVFAFYPFFIVVFGLGDLPQILIAFMLGVVAMIVNVLNGLDRVPTVLLKTARIMRLTPVDTTLRLTLPAASPYILTGVKLAVAYAFIGIIGSEFILSRGGIGYEISFAYNNFDNATMYPLIVLILLASIVINTILTRWEHTLLARRGMR